MTPAMILECKAFEERLPELPETDRAYVLGHKVALETTMPNDGSWERSMLSRLIVQYAWLLAYRNYVHRCLEQCGEPATYEEWMVSQ